MNESNLFKFSNLYLMLTILRNNIIKLKYTLLFFLSCLTSMAYVGQAKRANIKGSDVLQLVERYKKKNGKKLITIWLN